MHYLFVEELNGDLKAAIALCSDKCHKAHAERLGVFYRGWNGCHETQYDTKCAECGYPIKGIEEWR